MNSSILNSPLTSLNVHQIDLVFPYNEVTIPFLENFVGNDIIQLISSSGFRNFVICRNSTKLIDFYDLLYCGNPPDQRVASVMDKSLPPFQTSQISVFFTPTKIVTTKHQKMALFVFSIENYYEMLVLRYNLGKMNSPFRMQSLFNRPENVTLAVNLTTTLTINIKLPMTALVSEILQKAYDRMRQVYSGESDNICSIRYFRIASTFYDAKERMRRYPDPNKQLKDDPVILDCLRYQKKNPRNSYLFILMCPQISNFDKTVVELTKELDLCTIPSTTEILMFNTDMSLLRSEVLKDRAKLMNANPLMARMMISDTDPSIPVKKVDERYVIMKAELNTGSAESDPQSSASSKSSVSSMAFAIKVNYDMTANQAIQMFLEKLRSMKRNTRLSGDAYQSNPVSGPASLVPGGSQRARLTRNFTQSVINRQTLKPNSPPLLSQTAAQPSQMSPPGPSMMQYQTSPPPQIHQSHTTQQLQTLQPMKRQNLAQVPGMPTRTSGSPQVNSLRLSQGPQFDANQLRPPQNPQPNEAPQQNQGPVFNLSPQQQSLLTVPSMTGQSDNLVDESSESAQMNSPDNYVITIGGMDEIIAGDIPISHFVGVRHFIASGQQILSVNLADKGDVITSILEIEATKNASQIEINPETIIRPIVITKYPLNQQKQQNEQEQQSSNYPPNPINDDSGFVEHFNVKMCPQIRIMYALHINAQKEGHYFLRACLIYGNRLLCKPVVTKTVRGKNSLNFDEILVLPILMANIPREAQLSLTIYRDNTGGTAQIQSTAPQLHSSQIEAVATSNSALYTFTGWFDSGPKCKKMWRNRDLDFFLTTCESNEDDSIAIYFALPNYQIPICFIPPKTPDNFRSRATMTVPLREKERIEKLRTIDPLTPLTAEDKRALWDYRSFCFMHPELLSSMLDSIEYSDPEQVKEIPLLLQNWTRPSGIQALSLLDAKYANSHVRAYAVECLEQLSDNEVMLYLLQLVQALKYELYENSPLAQFLIRRGLTEPRVIGHQLFWQLMSEAHLSNIRMRFSLMIVNFMYGIGQYREELIKGFKFTQELVKLNKELSSYNYQTVQEPFREALKKIEIPKEFHLPVDSRLMVESFVIDKCKVMNSKKKPFFLVFKNAAPFATAPVMTMFKAGDDLRQDQLILQVMKIMEHLWRKENLDFEMRCYSVLPTGYNQGFIEVVPNAVTESDLQVDQGTFNKQLYIKYLRSKNPTDQQFEEARRNFLMSSVGYAVATCVLGVTDRHPGNIMIQDDGHFFHIDFGHFLGNFKKFNGIQMEDAPFHFISSYVELLDGKKSIYFKTFLSSGSEALNVLRKNAKLLITLLVLMIGTGIPELQSLEDIKYFKDMLFLNLKDEEIPDKFKELTTRSLKSWKTVIKAKVHNVITK